MRRALSFAAILVLPFLVFLPELHYAMVYDDWEQIVQNPRLTAWSYVPGYFSKHLWANNPLDPAYYYRPIFLLWLRLEDAILGPPGAIWHLASIVTHLGATVAVLLLIYRLIGDWKGAALAAGLFAIHPIHTEAVAWVSSVSEPLFTIFVCLCVYYYVGRNRPISAASLLFAALAMFTKETGIIVPVLILTYEWVHSNFKRALEGSAPYLIPLLLFVAFRTRALGTFNPKPPSNMSLGAMILTWPRVLAIYGAHLLWPVHLSLSYNAPIVTAVWPLLLLIAVVAGLVWAVRVGGENVRFGAAWFAITLLPALGIRFLLIDDYVHDRYLYLPTVGLALIVAVGLSKVRFTPPKILAACAVALFLCWATRADLRVWQNDTTLFRRAVETAPNNVYAKNNLANAYLQAHDEADAFPLLQQVIAMRPGDRQGYYNMARYYHQIGKYEEEAKYFAIFERILYEQQQQALH
jgi:protein O-mannosyl-transferase